MNTQTSYFKKALVVLMAMIMVFTMMPSMAWADGNDGTGETTLSQTLREAKQEVEATAATWNLTELKENLSLPQETSNGCEVVWKSSRTMNLTNAGEVKRPDVGRSDGTGTLTATIYDKADSVTLSFPFVVKAVQASEMEKAAKDTLETYLDQLQNNEKMYGNLTLFEGQKLGCNSTYTNFTKGIIMPVYFGGNYRNVYVTVAGDNEEVMSEAVYSGNAYGKNGKIVLPVTRGAEDRSVKLTFTMKVTASESWTVEKTIVVAAKASEAELASTKENAEKALAAIEDYDGSNAETLQEEISAAKKATDAAYKAGWTLAEIEAWKNYDKIASTEKLLENKDYTVKLTIQGYNKGDLYPDGDGSEPAYFIKAQPFKVKAGWSVYDVLKAAADYYGMSLGGSSTYVSAIAGLGEKMLGQTSGWMYTVNTNAYLPVGMSGYKVSDGDSVLIYYVKDMGSGPACSFDEIKQWADGKTAINLLGTNYLETLEKDWETIKTKLDANAIWYSNLPLPVRGEGNSRIVWKSSNPDIVSENGKITMGEDSENVTLTATLYAGDAKLVKTYDVKVGGRGGVTVTVKIEGKDGTSSLDPWTGHVSGGSVTQYDPTVTWQGYGEYILPGHALMTRLKAYDANFKFNDLSGLKSNSSTTMYATVGSLLGVKSEGGRYWRVQVISGDGKVRFESKDDSKLYFADGSGLTDGDTVIFRYTASLKGLQTSVNKAKGIVEDNYTAESYAPFKKALEKGEDLIANGFTAEQSAVDAAKAEIESAIEGLKSNVNLLDELPNLLKNLSKSEEWQTGTGDGYGVLALSRAGLSMTETGLARFIEAADRDLKNTYASRPTRDIMRSAIGMTALGKDLNYYIPEGGTKVALSQMWQDNFKDTNTSSMSLAGWLLISRTGAYPELNDGDKVAVEKHLLDIFDEKVGGWKGGSRLDIEYTVYAIMALADVYEDSTNQNHEAAVQKINKAIATLKTNYTKTTTLEDRCYIAMALMALGEDPETVKVNETGLISSFIPNLLADRTGFTESVTQVKYSKNYTPTVILTLQMYQEFKANGKKASLNVKDTYPVEAKKALKDALTEASAEEAENYSSDSYAPLAEAIEKAQKALYSLNTTAEQAKECENNLKSAVKNLVLIKDTTKLSATIAEAKAIDLKKYNYTEASQKALTDALSAAETVLTETDASQSRINAAETALRKAIDNLQVNGEEDIDNIIKAISKQWIADKSSTDDDWKIVDMAMLGKADNLFASESEKKQYVSKAVNGINPLSVTDYERVLIALTALGVDGSKLSEYRTFYDQKGNVVTNLVDSIQSFPESAMSINSATFALLAFDSGEYEIKDGAWSRENLIQYLLRQQLTDGGWNLQTSGVADPDVTAMAISALAPYAKDNKNVEDAINRALDTLSELQNKDGKYASYGTINSNSSAMVMLALASTGKDAANDEDFIKWSMGKQNSVLSGLLTFKTSASLFGYDNNRIANALSTEQGLRALAAYRSYLYAKAAVQPYAFGKPDAPEKWEEEAVAVSLEIVREPSKTTYQKGEKFESSGLAVKVTFSDGTVIEPAAKDLEIVGFDSSTTGERTLKVKYQNVYAVFKVKIEGSSAPSSNVVYLRVADPQGKTYFEKTELTYEQGETAFSVLGKAGLSYRPNWNTKYEGVYVEAIEGLGEFDCGPNSGWMYCVNGYFPSYSASLYKLKAGDYVEWLYTRDLGKDIGNSYSGTVEEIKDVTTDTKTKTTTSPTEVKVSEKTASDGTKTKVADVKVSADNQKEILKQVKASKSKEIILNVSKAAVGDATKADVTLDKSFIDSIIKDTDAKLTIKTPFDDKTYTQDELKAMSEATTGSTITVAIERAAEKPADDDAANIAKAKSIVKSMKLTARSSKTAKKNIKAVLKNDEKEKTSIKELKDLGYTIKYRFYRSTKKAASYKSTVTKKAAFYTNTSGKKGTKYFYKVQVRVHDENGKLVAKTALKQCKYASRVWTK